MENANKFPRYVGGGDLWGEPDSLDQQTGNSIVKAILLTLFAGSVAAWLTHVIVCLKSGLWGFLIAGAIFAPVGVVHGVGVWFGVW
jgi:hypothetical protein